MIWSGLVKPKKEQHTDKRIAQARQEDDPFEAVFSKRGEVQKASGNRKVVSSRLLVSKPGASILGLLLYHSEAEAHVLLRLIFNLGFQRLPF